MADHSAAPVSPGCIRDVDILVFSGGQAGPAAGFYLHRLARNAAQSRSDRLHFIQGAQRLGLRLEDIRNLLAIRDTGTCPCEPAADLPTRRLTELDEKIKHLEALRTEMAAMLDALPAEDCPQPTPGTWLHEERRC